MSQSNEGMADTLVFRFHGRSTALSEYEEADDKEANAVAGKSSSQLSESD